MTVAPRRAIHPNYGTRAPTNGSPARRAGSVRRTTTVDGLRPDGWSTLRLVGRGRDVLTLADGSTRILATAASGVLVDATAGQAVREVRTVPEVAGTEALVGRAASGGFRAALDAETDAERGSLVYLLLDETPATTLVSGYALTHAIGRGDLEPQAMDGRRAGRRPQQVPEICAGWQIGSIIGTALHAGGPVPAVAGPIAPSVVDASDPLGWHEAPPIGPGEMRRARRHDLWRDVDGLLHVDVFFRDSHVGPDGVETVVHEYTVEATVSPDATTVLDCVATPRVLPWTECPQAAASAGRLAGVALGGLRRRVRSEFVGPSTCTHLNDTLRELEDVVALAHALS